MMNDSRFRTAHPTKWLTVTAMLMAMNVVMSSFSIPVPGGHLYLNDAVICTAAILLGPLGAFLVGGAICVVGQLLIDYTKLTPARILVSFVVLGVILGGLGLYQPLIEFAGAGATVPLTGFGATLAKGVREAVAQKGWFGALTGGLSASSGGITAAIVAALTAGLLFRSAEK